VSIGCDRAAADIGRGVHQLTLQAGHAGSRQQDGFDADFRHALGQRPALAHSARIRPQIDQCAALTPRGLE